MRLRTGPDGYGLVTKALHWLTVVLVAAQFAVGWSLDLDDCDLPGEDRSGGDTSDPPRTGWTGWKRCARRTPTGSTWSRAGTFDLPELHLLLGLSILAMGIVRPLWRRFDGFPPWSDALSERDRWLVHRTERALMVLLLVVPLSGLLLVTTGSDDWLPVHIAAHIAFFVALAAHLYTNLRPRVLRRML